MRIKLCHLKAGDRFKLKKEDTIFDWRAIWTVRKQHKTTTEVTIGKERMYLANDAIVNKIKPLVITRPPIRIQGQPK